MPGTLATSFNSSPKFTIFIRIAWNLKKFNSVKNQEYEEERALISKQAKPLQY